MCFFLEIDQWIHRKISRELIMLSIYRILKNIWPFCMIVPITCILVALRAVCLCLSGRLAALNPAYVLPNARQVTTPHRPVLELSLINSCPRLPAFLARLAACPSILSSNLHCYYPVSVGQALIPYPSVCWYINPGPHPSVCVCAMCRAV